MTMLGMSTSLRKTKLREKQDHKFMIARTLSEIGKEVCLTGYNSSELEVTFLLFMAGF